MAAVVRHGLDYFLDRPSRAKGHPLIRNILEGQSRDRSDLLSLFDDDLAAVRAFIDAVPDAREVVLDCTDVLLAGYYESEDHPI